jgi:hypothetical protein
MAPAANFLISSQYKDLLFWVEFAALWKRLAEFSGSRRFEYLEKARECLRHADEILAKKPMP